jgi:RNA polymerase sigma factor (sigma-70 family)
VASLSDWEQVLTTLVRLRGAELKRYGYLLCGDAGDAEDLVQDALVRTFTFARRSEVTQLEHYVRKVMLNLWVDRTRRQRVWRRLMPLAATSDHQDAHEPSDLAAALRQLSARQRACLVLHYYVDLPVSEIAAQLEISIGSVKRHLHDARRRLAEVLGVDLVEREGGRATTR